jgi:hypothetical protein
MPQIAARIPPKVLAANETALPDFFVADVRAAVDVLVPVLFALVGAVPVVVALLDPLFAPPVGTE